MTIQVLEEKGQNHCQAARALGVTEGAVRCHLKRQAKGAGGGRKECPFKAEALAEVMRCWHADRAEQRRPVNVRQLWEHLVQEFGYQGSFRSVLQYVRAPYPRSKMRPYRRWETPPGAHAQTDWVEYPRVGVGEGLDPLHVFWMVLSHSHMPAAVWSGRQDQVSWHSCHNGAFRRLEGVPAVMNRIDNVKTAMSRGAGAWGTIYPTYRAYARAGGFHVDACPPRQPQTKEETEAKVRLDRRRVDSAGRSSSRLEDLQAWTDGRIADCSHGATFRPPASRCARAGAGSSRRYGH